MSSIETSDGGSLRVLGLLQVAAAVPGVADSVSFQGAGVQSAVLVGQGASFQINLTYDGPAGIDPLEFVAALGQAPNFGALANQRPCAIAPVDDNTFRVFLNSHDGAQTPQAISQGVWIAVWRNNGGTVPGTIVIQPA